MRRFIRWSFRLCTMSGVLTLMGCGPGQPFEDPSQRATREAAGTMYAETVVFMDYQAATIVALQATATGAILDETEIAMLNQQNAELKATLQSYHPPTHPITRSSDNTIAAPTPDPMQQVPGEYTDFAMSEGVDNNGCAENQTEHFEVDAPDGTTPIYFTVVGADITKDTVFSVDWFYGEEFRFRNDPWVADSDYATTCIYFFITSGDIPYEYGVWNAELTVNVTGVKRLTFEMCEAGACEQIAQ